MALDGYVLSSRCVTVGPTLIIEAANLQQHIYSFYQELLASDEHGGTKIDVSAWDAWVRLNVIENEALRASFTTKELELALVATRTNTASGPDGFLASFISSGICCGHKGLSCLMISPKG